MEKLKDKLALLVVEDNFLNQKLILLHLTKLGFVIDIANNGLEAVTMVKDKKYDLVLMDLMMPVMDGLEASIKIRQEEVKQRERLPIIGLTANTYDADREKCLAHGMDEYMTKPFDLKEFHRILKKLSIL
jgi:CheY-like chemotaxis protein